MSASAVSLAATAADLDADSVRVLLADRDPNVRAKALEALTARPREELAPALIAALADMDWHVRRAACDAVAVGGGNGASAALVRTLVDPHPSVRGRALVALDRRVGDDLDPILEYYLDAAAAPLRRALIEILGRRGRTQALLRFVYDPSVDVRLAVVRALAADRSAAAREALHNMRDDDDVAVRHAAETLLDVADEPRR